MHCWLSVTSICVRVQLQKRLEYEIFVYEHETTSRLGTIMAWWYVNQSTKYKYIHNTVTTHWALSSATRLTAVYIQITGLSSYDMLALQHGTLGSYMYAGGISLTGKSTTRTQQNHFPREFCMWTQRCISNFSTLQAAARHGETGSSWAVNTWVFLMNVKTLPK